MGGMHITLFPPPVCSAHLGFTHIFKAPLKCAFSHTHLQPAQAPPLGNTCWSLRSLSKSPPHPRKPFLLPGPAGPPDYLLPWHPAVLGDTNTHCTFNYTTSVSPECIAASARVGAVPNLFTMVTAAGSGTWGLCSEKVAQCASL